MSRRHKLPPLPPGYVRSFGALIICTDAGQHARARIAEISGAALPGENPSQIWHQSARGEPVDEWMGADGWRVYQFRCPRCRRNVPIREPRLIAAIAALAASGTVGDPPAYDISWRI